MWERFFALLNQWPPSYAIAVLLLGGIGWLIWAFSSKYGKDLIAAYREVRRLKAEQITRTNGSVYRDVILEQNRSLLNQVFSITAGSERQIAHFLEIMIDQQEMLSGLLRGQEWDRQVNRELLHQLKRNERKDDSVWFLLTTILGASGGDIRLLIERAERELENAEDKVEKSDGRNGNA